MKAGVKELLVISQDTSAYGLDLKYAESPWKGRALPARFLDLCAALGELGAWVRLHYVYPYPHVDERHPADGGGQDPPLPRHPLPARLARRAEGHAPPRRAGEDAGAASRAGATMCPDLAIRSTFIVGFPGETEADFQLLLDWLREAKLVARRLLPLRAGRGRTRQRSSRRGAGRGEGRALAPLHGGRAGGERGAACAASSAARST